MKDFDLSQIQTGSATGLDSFFQREPSIISSVGKAPVRKASGRMKVGSLAQLEGFSRVASDTLVHKSTKDLWSITREGQDLYIQRLFSDEAPLKEG